VGLFISFSVIIKFIVPQILEGRDPLFIILNPTNQPLWAILNSEFIVEEIIRTLTESIGLILAVPITTLLAAWTYSRKQSQSTSKS
jgi:uncharacterized membrane protein